MLLPADWKENEDTYVGFSMDGMRAFVAGAWSLVVYDMVKKKCEGVWSVPDGKRVYDVLDRRDFRRPPRVRDLSFNGMWVGYKDVDGKDGRTVARGVGFLVGDVFREFVKCARREDMCFENDPDGAEEVEGDGGKPKWRVEDGVWVCDVEGVERPYHKNLFKSFLRPGTAQLLPLNVVSTDTWGSPTPGTKLGTEHPSLIFKLVICHL